MRRRYLCIYLSAEALIWDRSDSTWCFFLGSTPLPPPKLDPLASLDPLPPQLPQQKARAI